MDRLDQQEIRAHRVLRELWDHEEILGQQGHRGRPEPRVLLVLREPRVLREPLVLRET